jgi:glutamine amidotransferase/cyclase
MLQVLEEASQTCFVPLTVGGGIRPYTDESTGRTYSAVEVAAQYFRAGADKVSIGSDAVYAAEQYRDRSTTNLKGMPPSSQSTGIEQISNLYGVQAVVVSIDPQRVYVDDEQDVIELRKKGYEVIYMEDEGRYCWYQCTVKGGREARDICAVTVARASEALGAGEIMLNCINMDGQCKGFDHILMKAVCNAVTIPVIASSGAGTAEHFSRVFADTGVQAALAAGMFHRQEVGIDEVKAHMEQNGIPARICYATNKQ